MKITADTGQLISGFSKAESRIGGFNNKLSSMRAPLLAVGTALTGLGVLGIKSASDLEQSIGGVRAVFGDAADEILAFSETADKSLGLSQRAFNEAVTPFAAMMKGAGLATDDVADKIIQLSQIAADRGAALGFSTQEVIDGLAAAFRGEADPAEKFGLRLQATKVAAKAVAMGLADTESAVDSSARATAFMSLVLEQTADTQHAFANESGSVAVQTQIMTARIEEFNAALGKHLLPFATKAVEGLNKLLDKFLALPEGTQKAIAFVLLFTGALILLGLILGPILTVGSVVAGIAGAIGAAFGVAGGVVLLIVGILLAIVGAVWFVWHNWDTVWEKIKDKSISIWFAIGGPIFFLITLIVGIVKAIIWVWKNWDEIWGLIKTIFNNVTDAIGDAWNDLWEGMKNGTKTAVNAIIGLVNGMINGVEGGINAIVDAINSIPDVNVLGHDIGIPDVPGVTLPRVPMLAEGGIVNRPTLAMIGEAGPEAVVPLNRMGGNTTVNVTINGNVDSPARAEQFASEIARRLRLDSRGGLNVAGA